MTRPDFKLEYHLSKLNEADFSDQRVLCRVDFNVPIDGKQVTDDTRIRAALPTIQTILDQQPKVLILLSHLGRPKGKRLVELSLSPIASILSTYLNKDVHFMNDCIGEEVETAIANTIPSSIWLLENTRFYLGETDNDDHFAASLARLGDVFVNDAFGTCHRAHASNVGLAKILPSYSGLLVEREVYYLGNALQSPKRPFISILGGAKVSDKITILESLLDRADRVLIGGGMANTFLAAQEIELGDSLVEWEAIPLARKLLKQSVNRIVLPIDVTLSPPAGENAEVQYIRIGETVLKGWRIMDIGPKSVALFTKEIEAAQTIVWNGPLGVTEIPEFAVGSSAIAKEIAEQTDKGATSIIGGGDSAAAIHAAGCADRVSHLSTGGGASLALLAGESLPGLTIPSRGAMNQ